MGRAANRHFGVIWISILLSRNRKGFVGGLSVKRERIRKEMREQIKVRSFQTFHNNLNIDQKVNKDMA